MRTTNSRSASSILHSCGSVSSAIGREWGSDRKLHQLYAVHGGEGEGGRGGGEEGGGGMGRGRGEGEGRGKGEGEGGMLLLKRCSALSKLKD